MNKYVYVLNKHGKPLMPTSRFGKVRYLLKNGLAVPVCNNPFTIKLKYEVGDKVQPLIMGIDPGRENIGAAVIKENGDCVFLEELITNNKTVKKNMDERRMHRQARRHHKRLSKQRKAIRDNNSIKNGEDDTIRNKKPCKRRTIIYPSMEKGTKCKAIKGAEAQFANRKRHDGWITPSGRQLIQMHMKAIEEIRKFLPITHVVLEKNVFDFQKMENENIQNWQYSKGPLYGYESYKNYIYDQQNGKCLLCGNKIEQYHHIKPRSKGGSDTPANIAGLCNCCHNSVNGVHKNPEAAEALEKAKKGLSQKYKVSLLNTVMPALIEIMGEFCEENDIEFSLTDGYKTATFRKEHNLSKRHCLDAYAIACSSIGYVNVKTVKFTEIAYIARRFKKKSAANIQKLNSRQYFYNDVLVAVNRHKAEGQVSDSLEEYITSYALAHTEEECKEHLRQLIVKPAKRTYLAHKDGEVCPIKAGDVVKYEKHCKNGNIKKEVFVAEGVKITNGAITNGTKAKSIKYCKTLSSGSIAIIKQERIN